MLQWAREHHCPWNELTCRWASEHEEFEVLKWAIEHGCPGGEDYCVSFRMNAHPSPTRCQGKARGSFGYTSRNLCME
jgi:hypothetical protein